MDRRDGARRLGGLCGPAGSTTPGQAAHPTSPTGTPPPDRPPGAPTPARQTYLLARALSVSEDQAAGVDGDLARVRSAWARSGLLSAGAAPGLAQPSGKGVRRLHPDVAARLDAFVERLARLPAADDGGVRSAGPDGVLLIAALLLAGAEPRRRPSVRLPVVFGTSHGDDADRGSEEAGAVGVLELREFPAGPPGLYPDPRSMAGLRSGDDQFARALGRAWALAGRRRGFRCVLWRLVPTDPPGFPPSVEGPSLGAAFALGLRELLRHPPTGRPGAATLRGVFHGLRPRTAVTGALGDGERLVGISGMESKLVAARRRGLRLVAPAANRPDAAHAPEPGDVRFAETLRQADRYARRFRTARLVTALSLVAAAVTSGVVVEQRQDAARDRMATAHRLAGVADTLLRSDVGLAELFAEQAYRRHPDTLTRGALFRAVTAAPHLAGSARASGTVSAVAVGSSGRAAVAGTRDGAVERWTLSGPAFGAREAVGRLDAPVDAVAADGAGRVVAASAGGTVHVWADGADAPAPRVPGGHKATAVAVSPSGRFVAVATTTSRFGVPPTLWILDRRSGRTGRLDLKEMEADPSAVAFADDTEAVVVESGYGAWYRVSAERLTRTAGGTVHFKNTNVGFALAPDGSHFTYSNKGATLPVWPSRGSPDIEKPALRAAARPGHPAALAVSPGGTRVASAFGTTLYVSATAPGDRAVPDPVVLPGAGAVADRALAFAGRDSRLVSASGDVLTLWDLDQHSRIAATAALPVPSSCEACGAPRVSVSPDGRDAAVINGDGSRLAVQRLGPPGERERPTKLPPTLALTGFAELLWRPDGSGLIVLAPDGSATTLERGTEWRGAGSWPAPREPAGTYGTPGALRFLPDGRVAEADGTGTVRFRDAASGKVLRRVPGPKSMAPKPDSPAPTPVRGGVALDARAAHAAVLEDNVLVGRPRVHVLDTASGDIRTIDAPDAAGIAYAGDRLLLQRRGGILEAWTASGSRRLATLEGTPGMGSGPVVGENVVAETASEDGTVHLLDLPSETVLGTLAPPKANKPTSTGMAFTADGTRLITVTEAPYAATEAEAAAHRDLGSLVEWTLDPRAWARTVCSTSGGGLQPAEWERYMGGTAPPGLRCGG
ncbi:hypothetical protein ABT104_12495 [Streptomyces mobaraensis]|uniref:hypothetical protein n=1 Tax=Streptomyces mobaraensis TaxID=35621 RepID=UPI0033188015